MYQSDGGEGASRDDAEKKAASEKMQRILADPIMKPLLEDLCQWLARILDIEITPEKFTVPLQTGDDLCKLAVAISAKAQEQGMPCPKMKFKAGAKAGSFQARCNIETFVKWAKDLGVRETCLFETVDIVELKFLRNVLICLLEISRLADKYGVEPPELVKLEKSTKIRWQDLIKLSMKRNSSGEVLSVAAISSTVGEIQEEVSKADEEGLSLERSSSVVKRWKSFTRSSLRSRGEAVSPDPNKILDEPRSSPQSGTPDSMLSDMIGSPDSMSMMDVVEEVLETQKYPEAEEGPATVAIDIGATASPPTGTSIGSVTVVSSPELNIEIEDVKPDDTTLLEFGLSTEDPESDKDEVLLTLEDVTMPYDSEDVTVEEMSMDDQDFSIAMEQNLVEAVHSQPDLEAPELMVDIEAKPMQESEPLVATDVALEIDLETGDIIVEDQDLDIVVKPDLVEAVLTEPDLEAPELMVDIEAKPMQESEPMVAIDVAIESKTEDIASDNQDLDIAVKQDLVEAVHTKLDSESSGLSEDEEEITLILKSERVVVADVILGSETEDMEDEELMISVEPTLVEVVHSQPGFEAEQEPALEVKPVAIAVGATDTVTKTAGRAEDESSCSSLSEDEAFDTPKMSYQPRMESDSEKEGDPGGEVSIVYEKKDSALPSAPVMEILVHKGDQDKVPASTGLASQGEQDGHTNLAFEGDSIDSRGQSSSGPDMSSSFEVSATGSVSGPAGASNQEEEGPDDKVAITWWFALCFPAVFEGNRDGSCLSEEQVEELDYKRSIYLLLGIILTVIGTALAITDGCLGVNSGSGAASSGKLSQTWFFVILALALVCLIIGISLISLWVVQHLKMKNRKLSFGNSRDYGAIR